jgi:hypothetical protein
MKQLTAIALVVLAIFAGCKSDSNPVADASLPAKPTAWKAIVFANPIKNTTNAYAVKISGLIADVNLAATAPWIAQFDAITSEHFKNIDQWTLTSGNLTETLAKTSNGDTTASCTLTYDGTVGAASYANTLMYTGSYRNDGKSGSWSNVPGTQLLEYSIDAQGTKLGKWKSPSFGTTTIADSANGNGSLFTYFISSNPYQALRAQWLPDGSGTWTSLDVAGNQNGSGIWGK